MACMCGDYLCPSCGNPAAARTEAAAEALLERLADLKLTEDEYGVAADAAEFAVKLARAAVEREREYQRLLAEEDRAFADQG